MQTKKGYSVFWENSKLYIFLAVNGHKFKCLLGDARHLSEIHGSNDIPNEKYFASTVEMIERAAKLADLYIHASSKDEVECRQLFVKFVESQDSKQTVLNQYIEYWIAAYFKGNRG